MKILAILTVVILLAGPALAGKTGKTAGKKTAAKQAVKTEPATITTKTAPEPLPEPPAEKEQPAKETAQAAEASQTPEAAPAQAVVSETVKAESARPLSCPNCFLPLLTGYTNIMNELKSWTAEMETQAADHDLALSAIQKRIDAKDDEIAKAKLGTEKKTVKAAVKSLTKEHKLLLKEYGAANDKKTEFYKQFSKEIAKKTEDYNKIALENLKQVQSAASLQY
jgi:Sec-independent protein translocase protein TatA